MQGEVLVRQEYKIQDRLGLEQILFGLRGGEFKRVWRHFSYRGSAFESRDELDVGSEFVGRNVEIRRA